MRDKPYSGDRVPLRVVETPEYGSTPMGPQVGSVFYGETSTTRAADEIRQPDPMIAEYGEEAGSRSPDNLEDVGLSLSLAHKDIIAVCERQDDLEDLVRTQGETINTNAEVENRNVALLLEAMEESESRSKTRDLALGKRITRLNESRNTGLHGAFKLIQELAADYARLELSDKRAKESHDNLVQMIDRRLSKLESAVAPAEPCVKGEDIPRRFKSDLDAWSSLTPANVDDDGSEWERPPASYSDAEFLTKLADALGSCPNERRLREIASELGTAAS